MKLTFFLMIFTCLAAYSAGYSQQVSISAKNERLIQVIKKLRKQSDYAFVLNAELLKKSKPVNIQAQNKELQYVLQEIFAQQPLDFEIKDKTITVIEKKSAQSLISGLKKTQTQQQSVSGKLTDTTGNTISGATITVKGTNRTATSDNIGQFTIQANPSETLLIKHMSFAAREIIVGTSTQLGEIQLQANTADLDEVIVIGYGTTTRRRITGAVDQVTANKIQNRPVANLTQALQGAAPSLVIQQKSMNPNDNSMNVNIRGVNTVTNADPLVVIDGMISNINNMNKLNSNDVASISVLKDAGTAAIYGSRSASGVILVTTKTGAKNSAPQIRAGASYGVQTPDILYQPVEGWQNATLMNVALANGGQAPAYTPEQIQDLKDNPDAEWAMDYIFKNAQQQNYDLNISGGSASTSYMVSGGFFNQGSNFIGPGYGTKRYNLRTKVSTEYKRLKLDVILGYVRNDIKGDEANAGFKIADASRTPKYYYNTPKAPDGRYIMSSVGTSPGAGLELGGYNRHNNDWINVGTNLEIKITNDLKARAVFGLDNTSDWRFIRRLQYPLYNSVESMTPVMQGTNRETENYASKNMFINSQALLDYNKSFGKHTIAVMGGVSQEVITNRGIDAKTRFTDADLGIPINNGEDDKTIFDDSRTEVNGTIRRVIQSAFARINYNYDERYSADLTIRADGSSRFPKENRWGTFPSVSLGWNASEESFMENYKNNVGDVKFRGSWGILGNQEIGDFLYFTTYDIHANTAGFNNVPVSGTGFTEASPNIKWEEVNSRNIGVDLTFLNRSLAVSFDVFSNTTNDILIKPVTPGVYGTEVAILNIGAMKNRGWELNVNYNFATGPVTHGLTFNIGNTKNIAVDLGRPEVSTVDNVGFIRRNGLPLGAYYGLKTDGLFQSYDEVANSAVPVGTSPQPGDVKYIDRNGDGIISDDDRFYLGDAFPHYNFGLNYNGSYKGFDFSILVQGVGERLQSLRGDIYTPFHNGGWYPVIFKHQLDTWSVTNTDAKYPRLTTNSGNSFANNWGQASDLYILDAKYIRVKNIQIGYTLPEDLGKRLGVGKIRVYANAQNPFTFSKNGFIDPESTEFGNTLSASGGNSGRNYPTLKFYGAGINVDF